MFFFCPTFNVLSFSRVNSLRSLDSGFRISLLGKMLQKSEFRRKVFFLLAAENRSSGLSSRGVSLRGLEMVLREVRLISGSFFISYFLLILLNLLGM
jgi:hypothetical protein